jgi:hypothetical protein
VLLVQQDKATLVVVQQLHMVALVVVAVLVKLVRREILQAEGQAMVVMV